MKNRLLHFLILVCALFATSLKSMQPEKRKTPEKGEVELFESTEKIARTGSEDERMAEQWIEGLFTLPEERTEKYSPLKQVESEYLKNEAQLKRIPVDVWAIILASSPLIKQARTVDEVVKNIRLLARVNRFFNNLLHQPAVVKSLFEKTLDIFNTPEKSLDEKINNIKKVSKTNASFYDYGNQYLIIQNLIKRLFEQELKNYKGLGTKDYATPDQIANSMFEKGIEPANEWLHDGFKLIQAVDDNDKTTIQKLIDKKLDFYLIDEFSDESITAHAINTLNLEILQLLIENMKVDHTFFKFLLRYSVDSVDPIAVQIYEKPREEQPILKNKVIKIFKYLIENTKNLKDDTDGILARAIINYYDFPEIIELLLKAGASPNAYVPDMLRSKGSTPLDIALHIKQSYLEDIPFEEKETFIKDMDTIINLLKEYGVTV